MSKAIKVLYIMGAGRSGTTLLDMVLGQLEGYVSCGELIRIYNPEAVCSCGQPVHKGCDHWGPIWAEAFGADQDSKEVMGRMESSVPSSAPLGYMHHILRSGSKDWLKGNELSGYLDDLDRLYMSLARESQAKVIVDSSKSPPYGYLLSLLPSIDFYIVHLVRDARAVIYSWEKGKFDPSSKEHRLKRSFLNSLWLWTRSNLATSLVLARTGAKCIRIKYEDFVKQPRTFIDLIQNFVDETEGKTPFIDERTFRIEPIHTVEGNPIRFDITSEITIKYDNRWRQELSLAKQVTTYLSTVMLMKYYDLTTTSYDVPPMN